MLFCERSTRLSTRLSTAGHPRNDQKIPFEEVWFVSTNGSPSANSFGQIEVGRSIDGGVDLVAVAAALLEVHAVGDGVALRAWRRNSNAGGVGEIASHHLKLGESLKREGKKKHFKWAKKGQKNFFEMIYHYFILTEKCRGLICPPSSEEMNWKVVFARGA